MTRSQKPGQAKPASEHDPTATIRAGVAPDELKMLQEIIDTSIESEQAAQEQMRAAYRVMKPLFRPVIVGKQNLPEEPIFLIGNHAAYALDVPFIVAAMLCECGRFTRGMADRMLFQNPRVRGFLSRSGALVGHPYVCSSFMQRGDDLLVFPGGAYEVNKPVKERYLLKWKDRTGFVKLAAEHGYTIVPIATVGPDEFYDRHIEGEELAESPLGQFLQRIGALDLESRPDMLPGIPKGILGGLLPKPQRVYIGIGEPVRLAAHEGSEITKDEQRAVRDEVAERINALIGELLLMRAQKQDKDSWLRKVLTR